MRPGKLILFPLLLAIGLGAAPQAPSPVVQVAINYGPGKTVLVSGVIVGDGRFVLTQANLLDGAYDTAIALSSGDVVEPTMEHVDERFNVALLRLPGSVKTSAAIAAEVPAGEVSAAVLGSPESFAVGKSIVRLVPVAGARRWKLVPSVPASFRGGAIVNNSSALLGIVVEVGGELAGIPVTEFLTAPKTSRIAERVQSALAEAAKALAPAEPAVAPAEPAAEPARAPRPVLSAPVLAVERARRPAQAMEAPPQPAPVEVASNTVGAIPTALPVTAARPEPPPARPEPAPVAKKVAPEPAPRTAAATAAVTTPATAAPGPDAALAAWEERISAEPGNMDLRLQFGEVLLNAKMYDRSLQVLEAAREQFPAAATVYWHLGRAYWVRALHKDDGTPRRSMDKKPYLRARWAFEAFLKVAPDDYRASQVRDWIRILKKADSGRY